MVGSRAPCSCAPKERRILREGVARGRPGGWAWGALSATRPVRAGRAICAGSQGTWTRRTHFPRYPIGVAGKKRPQPFDWDALPPRSPDDTMPAGNACELPSGSLTDTTTRGVMLHNARPHRAIHHEMLRAMLAWRGRASATLCHPLSDNLLARNGPAPCCGRTPVRSAGCLATLFSCYPIADTTRAEY